LARTAVNAQSGARTQLAGIISALLMIVALLALTPVFYYIPMACLGIIIQVAVVSLFDLNAIHQAWKISRADFGVLMATFWCTLIVGVDTGIFVGVLCSVVVVMKQAAFPHTAVLGRLPDSGLFRNVKRYPKADQIPSLGIVRMDATLMFANCEHFRMIVEQVAAGQLHSYAAPIKVVIVDASGWGDIDLSGLLLLRELLQQLKKQSITLAFANVKGPLNDRFERAGLVEELGKENLFFTLADAVATFYPSW
jgi:SulP family sulfate permease